MGLGFRAYGLGLGVGVGVGCLASSSGVRAWSLGFKACGLGPFFQNEGASFRVVTGMYRVQSLGAFKCYWDL